MKIRVRNQTIQKTFPSSAEFQKFLKTEESLYSYYMSECELYCLANVLGVPIYQLTYNLVGVGGKPEERCRYIILDLIILIMSPFQVGYIRSSSWTYPSKQVQRK